MGVTLEQFFERAKIKDPRLTELLIAELTAEELQAENDRLRAKLDSQTEPDPVQGDG